MKIKKGLFTVLFTLMTSVISFAQLTDCKVADIEKLKLDGTVTVAISDDEAKNKSLEEIMKSYWTASKYTIIKESELEAYINANPENYILAYSVDNKTIGSSTKNAKTLADCLVLVKNLKKIKKLSPFNAMVYCFIDYGLGATSVNVKVELIRQIGAMNAILAFPNLQGNQIGGWKIPTINQKEIITKELWIDEEKIKAGEDLAKMKAMYNPYKFKIVTKEEIAKAVIEKKKGVVYLAQVEYVLFSYMLLIHSAEDNRVLFFSMGMNGGRENSFDSKELEKIKKNKPYGQ